MKVLYNQDHNKACVQHVPFLYLPAHFYIAIQVVFSLKRKGKIKNLKIKLRHTLYISQFLCLYVSSLKPWRCQCCLIPFINFPTSVIFLLLFFHFIVFRAWINSIWLVGLQAWTLCLRENTWGTESRLLTFFYLNR